MHTSACLPWARTMAHNYIEAVESWSLFNWEDLRWTNIQGVLLLTCKGRSLVVGKLLVYAMVLRPLKIKIAKRQKYYERDTRYNSGRCYFSSLVPGLCILSVALHIEYQMRHISHPEGQFPDHTKTGARGRVTPSYCSSQLPWWAWNAVSVCMVVICCFRKTKVKSFFPHHVAECMHACCHVSPVPLFMTLWTVTCQALLSTGLSRQEHWSGLPRPPPGDLPDPGIQYMSLRSPTLAGGLLTTSAAWEAHLTLYFS